MPVEEEEREVKISDYYYKKSDIDTQMNNKVDKDGNKVLSDNNYTNADKAKLTNMTPADYVTSQSLSSTLSSYVVTSTLNNYYTQSEIDNIVNTINNNKISKSQTAGLIKNDGTIDTTTYSTASHTHGNLQTNGAIGTSNNANKNVITDANGKITTENKPVIPTNVSDLTNDAGYLTSHQDLTNYIQKSQTTGLIKNDGTIDTTTYLTTHQDISGKEDSNNKVTSWTPTTTDTHYPSEKLVKDSLDGKINTSDIVDNVTTNDATKVLSAKQGKALSDGISNLGNSFGQTITGVYNNIPTKTSDLTNDGSDGANIFVSSNDSRLTNARTPTSHGHGNISNTGSIGGAGGKPLITEAYGKITTGSFGTTSGTFAEGNHTHNQYLTSHQSLSDIGGTVTIEKQSIAETGYAATYVIKQGGTALSPKINIPKDYLVKSASLEVVGATPTTLETNNNLVTGDKYLKFVVNTQENDDITNLIIPVNDLGQEYDADNTTIVLNNGVFSVKSNVFADKTHTHSQYLTEHQSLSDYVQKSQTNGLLKNDGTVDTNTYVNSNNIKTVNNESLIGSGNITVSSDTIKGGYISAYEPSLVLIDDTVTTLEITITDIPSNYIVQSVKINGVNDNTVFNTVMYESYTENNISYNKWTIKFPLSNYKDYVVRAGIFMQETSDYYLYDLEDSIGMPITVSFNDLPTEKTTGEISID